MVATDAAGEGINLQFCWLMVNYDIPWNPARLEQRMGRVHRYKQKHDPVIILNLVAAQTREGRVVKTLLDKLERMRKELNSDKVFDVIGRLFEGISLKAYLEDAITEDGADRACKTIEGSLTPEQIRAYEAKQQSIFGDGGDVRRELGRLRQETDQEVYRRLLPGYVRQYIEKAAPLVDIELQGDTNATSLSSPNGEGALTPCYLFSKRTRRKNEKSLRCTVHQMRMVQFGSIRASRFSNASGRSYRLGCLRPRAEGRPSRMPTRIVPICFTWRWSTYFGRLTRISLRSGSTKH